MMKAVILAAGYGNRMRPLTDNCHKTLLKIGDRTIIERIVDGLVANQVTDITIVTGYRREELTTYLHDRFPGMPFHFVHNPRYRETNNVYSLALAFRQMQFEADLILIESDLIFEPSVIERVIHAQETNVALVDRFRSGMDGTVVTVENKVITSVIPPHLQGPRFDFTDKYKTLNIYKFSREFCASTFVKLLTYYATAIDANCYYELILGILIYMQRETVHAEILEGERWAEVDDPNDLSIAEFVFNDEARRPTLQRAHGGFWSYDITDYCYIRNMYFPTNALISEMRDNLPALLRNYGSTQSVLDRKAAYFLLCDARRLHVLNGASQIYPILRGWLGGKRVLLPSPTFGEYPRIFPEHDTYRDAVGIDRADLERRCEQADVIVVVNPNNPTGTILPTDWIHRLAAQRPDKMFLVDESFIEFSEEPTIVEELEREPLDNVLVVKSLSKSLGMPGLRLGFAYTCNQEISRRIGDEIPIWNLNSIAEFALETMLKHRPALFRSFEQTKSDRDAFAEALSGSDLVERVYPSAANFLLVSTREAHLRGHDLVELLLSRHNVFIHDATKKISDGKQYYRLAVRLPHENMRLARMLDRSTLLSTP